MLPTLLTAHVALAQTSADCDHGDATACGRYHFEVGAKAFEAGDFKQAASEFQAALEQRPHAVIRFNLALSLARLGHPKAAIELLAAVQSDPEVDKALAERAAKERRSAEEALARVTVRLRDPRVESVELDGAPVLLDSGGELALDPGPHQVRVTSGSSVVLDQEVELSPGERVELRVGERSRRIDVVVVPEAAPPPPKPVAPSRPRPEPPHAPLSPTWFYVGAGATLVLTGLTVWSGLDTEHAYDAYQRDLPHLTQPQADQRVKNGHSRELRTNLLLAGSLTFAAGTAVVGLWLVDFSAGSRSHALAPAGLTVAGRF